MQVRAAQQQGACPTGRILRWAYLGSLEYRRALALQQQLRSEVERGQRPDTLLLLEHPPVITLGRSADAEHVLLGRDALERRGVACVRVERGGDVTYHGPGQLVGYPIRRVGRAVRAHVDGMYQALREFVGALGIDAWWDDAAPGLWTESGKIAAVGVDARGGVTTHGFALNLAPRLDDFAMIVPCGLPKPVTSVERLLGSAPAVGDAAGEIASRLAHAYGAPSEPADSTAILGSI